MNAACYLAGKVFLWNTWAWIKPPTSALRQARCPSRPLTAALTVPPALCGRLCSGAVWAGWCRVRYLLLPYMAVCGLHYTAERRLMDDFLLQHTLTCPKYTLTPVCCLLRDTTGKVEPTLDRKCVSHRRCINTRRLKKPAIYCRVGSQLRESSGCRTVSGGTCCARGELNPTFRSLQKKR